MKLRANIKRSFPSEIKYFGGVVGTQKSLKLCSNSLLWVRIRSFWEKYFQHGKEFLGI